METPSLETWRELYRLAGDVRAMSPWRWMFEEQLVGVQDPVTNEVHFISVMGTRGEHLAIAVYPGRRGLRLFQTLQKSNPRQPDFAEIMFGDPQLQLSFENRSVMTPWDIRLFKSLGLKYRGSNAWPQFLTYRPSHYPWHLDAEECRLMRVILTQGLTVWPQFQKDPQWLESLPPDHYLVRVQSGTAGGAEWSEEIRKMLPDEEALTVVSKIPSCEKLSALPKRPTVFELDVWMKADIPVREKEERPFFPFMFMMVDAPSFFVLGVEILSPVPSVEAMWGTVAEKVCQCLIRAKMAPAELVVRKKLLLGLLDPLARQADIQLRLAERLPAVENVVRSMPHLGG